MRLQITVEGKAYEVEVEVLDDGETVRSPGFAQHPLYASTFPVHTGSSAPSHGGSEAISHGNKCHSPVTGLVIRVHVEPGQAVQPNDLIMVLEAMKMETNVLAPAAATVKSVLVAPGDSVKLNQLIVEFE